MPKIDLNGKVNPFGLGRFWATFSLFKKWLRNHSIASVKSVGLNFEVISGWFQKQVPKIDLNGKVNPFGLGRFWATFSLFKKMAQKSFKQVFSL